MITVITTISIMAVINHCCTAQTYQSTPGIVNSIFFLTTIYNDCTNKTRTTWSEEHAVLPHRMCKLDLQTLRNCLVNPLFNVPSPTGSHQRPKTERCTPHRKTRRIRPNPPTPRSRRISLQPRPIFHQHESLVRERTCGGCETGEEDCLELREDQVVVGQWGAAIGDGC